MSDLYRGPLIGGSGRQAPLDESTAAIPIEQVQPVQPGVTKMENRFTVLEDFFCDELQTQYLRGYSYTVRDGDDVLDKLVPKWIEQGKARPGGPQAEVSGTAEVSDSEDK